MFFTLPGLIFNIIGVVALMRSEWLQKQPPGVAHRQDPDHGHSDNPPSDWFAQPDPDAAFSLWMLGGLALIFGFSLHIAALFV